MNEVNESIARAADEILDEAIENIASRLPDDESKADFMSRLDDELRQSVRSAIDGGDYQTHLRRGAYETSVWLAEHYADIALDRLSKKLPRGKTRDTIGSALEQLTHRGIESFCRGASLDEIKRELSDCAIDQFKSYATPEFADFMYRGLKTSGKGSRALNRQIKNGSNIVAAEAVGNVGEWMSGRKTFDQALVDTAKDSALAYGEQQGESLAKQAFKSLAKDAENRIGKNVVSTALNQLANSNALITTAGAVIDIGQSFKQLLDGKITTSEFLGEFTRKGVDIVVQNSATTLGGMIGGAVGGVPGAMIGAAVGSVINYFASSFLNSVVGSLRNLRAEAEYARKRREFIEAFCDYSIREMDRQQIEFRRTVEQFLSNRRRITDASLSDLERAIKNNDFDGINRAIKTFSSEFGYNIKTYDSVNEYHRFLLSDKPLVWD